MDNYKHKQRIKHAVVYFTIDLVCILNANANYCSDKHITRGHVF